MFWFGDYTFILLIPAMILAMYAQTKVQSTFGKYSKIAARSRMTGAQVAREMLRSNNIDDVSVEQTHGRLSDHYDPKRRVLRLSPDVYNSNSLAALGVAAHEAGHALQHYNGYAPLAIRSAIVPMASIGSRAAVPLIFLGLFMGQGGNLLIDIGILAFSLTVLFQLITLPVEFNASNRAIEALETGGYLTRNEIGPARKVLNAAALTYVAATIVAIMQLLRFLLIRGRRR